MVEGVTQANQAYITGTPTVSAGTTLTINDSTGNKLYEYAAGKSANYIFFSSPAVVSGSSYTITAGSATSTATATTDAQSGGMGGPGGQTPPSGGPGEQTPPEKTN